MRVLFLDIDGVLNKPHTKERCGNYIGVDRKLSTKLLDWLNKTDVKIVLSSTWRKHKDMWQHLNDAGIHWIDTTPDLGGYHARGIEIEAWMAEKPADAYAILDDIPVFLPHQMTQLVQTNELVGLSDDDIQQLSKLLP